MRLIDGDALIERMKKDPLFPLVERYGVTGVIEAEPTVDAEPVRHGHWIEKNDFDYDNYYECSVCHEPWVTIEGTPMDNFMNYCPKCGAMMDEEAET